MAMRGVFMCSGLQVRQDQSDLLPGILLLYSREVMDAEFLH
jgi:hypothetical protein